MWLASRSKCSIYSEIHISTVTQLQFSSIKDSVFNKEFRHLVNLINILEKHPKHFASNLAKKKKKKGPLALQMGLLGNFANTWQAYKWRE